MTGSQEHDEESLSSIKHVFFLLDELMLDSEETLCFMDICELFNNSVSSSDYKYAP
jgi:hypothetical protein